MSNTQTKPGTFVQVSYYTVDNYEEHQNFHTIEEAQKWAHATVGKAPSFGRGYAISDDGVGKIAVRGCSLKELFPDGI